MVVLTPWAFKPNVVSRISIVNPNLHQRGPWQVISNAESTFTPEGSRHWKINDDDVAPATTTHVNGVPPLPNVTAALTEQFGLAE